MAGGLGLKLWLRSRVGDQLGVGARVDWGWG